jgi:hypothetical protein
MQNVGKYILIVLNSDTIRNAIKKNHSRSTRFSQKKNVCIYMLKLIQHKFRYKINECIISPSEKVAALISSLILENIRYKIHDEDNKNKKTTKKLNPEDLNCE